MRTYAGDASRWEYRFPTASQLVMRLGSRLVSLGLTFALGAGTSLAQDTGGSASDDPWAGVEEMMVTGNGEQILTMIDTSAAIGFDAEMLQAEGVSDVGDLAAFTPNLEIKTAFAAVNPTIFVRGVGLDDFNSNSSSAVSIVQDGIYMNSPAGQLFGLFDIEGIEVLRGPAPTITNASAGAILIRSNRPKDEFEASLISTFGNYDLRQFEGVVNVPVIPDRLAIRTAFKIQQRGGTTKNRCPGIIAATAQIENAGERNSARGNCRFADPESLAGNVFEPPAGPSDNGKDWVNDQDNWAARGLISYRMPLPNEQEVNWLLTVSGGQNKSLATQYQHVGMSRVTVPLPDPDSNGLTTKNLYFSRTQNGEIPFDRDNYRQASTSNDNFAGEYDRVGPERLDLLSISLNGDWSLSDTIEISSLSGYSWHDRETFANDDAGPKSWQNNDYVDDAWQFTQEITTTWLWSEENESKVGAYFLTEELDANNIFRDNSVRPNNPQFNQDYEQDTILWAFYAQTHFELPPLPGWGEFTENFSLDASVRYNWAQKQMDNVTSRSAGGFTVGTNQGIEKEDWTGWTGDAVLTYRFTEEIRAYFKYSRGWKPGHFNANTFTSSQPVSAVNPETIDSLEVALRADWFDGRLKTNVTAFKYEYQDLQVFQTTTDASSTILNRLINSEQADIWGVEWEVTAEPLDRLILFFAGGYLDSEYTSFSTSFERAQFRPGEGFRIIEVEADYSGNRLIASPNWSLTGSAEYTIPSRIGDLTPRASFSYRSKTFFDANEGCGAENNIPECLLQQSGYWIFNATLRYVPPGGTFEVLAFVRNILDEEYKAQSFDQTSANSLILDIYGEPRTFGAAITFRFD